MMFDGLQNHNQWEFCTSLTTARFALFRQTKDDRSAFDKSSGDEETYKQSYNELRSLVETFEGHVENLKKAKMSPI